MRLATRTGLAAFAAALIAVAVGGVAVQARLGRVLEQSTDDQLRARAADAAILVALADRLRASELNGIVEGAQVVTADGDLVRLGQLPEESLPAPGPLGFATADAAGERWRLYTVAVADVPGAGDAALVQLVAPLGDVDARTRQMRRNWLLVGLLFAGGAGAAGLAFGRRAARPLVRLRDEAAAIDRDDPTTWSVSADSGTPDVDEVAQALDAGLRQLADETRRRAAALEAARSFAGSATHELRTPLQSALTNLDIAATDGVPHADRAAALDLARGQLRRAASGLAAVRALADAEFADPGWFGPADLGELVDAAVAGEVRDGSVQVAVDAGPPVAVWADGVMLAVANVVRNARVHGGPGVPVTVTVRGAEVIVDDAGPGIPVGDRERVVGRFERGSTPQVAGSGLGLAIAHEVARAHGGGLTIGDSPLGGARVTLRFAAPAVPAIPG